MRSENRSEIRSLTGLRGVAALLVVLFHACQQNGFPTPLNNLVQHGYLCVELFFVMSGYVMCLSYERLFADGLTWRRYGNFLSKRLGRTYPLYAAILLITLALAGRLIPAEPVTPLDLLWNVLLVQSWGLADSIVLPSWSISTEFAAYLAFPALLVLVRRGTALLAGAVAMLLLATLYLRAGALLNQTDPAAPWRLLPPGSGPITVEPLLRCFGGFTLGMVAYRLVQRGDQPDRQLGRQLGQDRRHGGPLGRWRHAGDAVAALTVVLFCLPGTDLLLMPLFVLLVISLATQASLAGRLLASRPVHWLGMISYSIYLVHILMLLVLREPLRAWLPRLHVPHAYSVAPLLVPVLVIPVAAVTYALIEKPGRDAARWLLGFRRTAIATEPGAP